MITFLYILGIIGNLLFTVGSAIEGDKSGLLKSMGFGCISCIILILIGYVFGGIN